MITYTLKPDQSTENIRKQMKVFGGLVEEPTYESVELTIYIDEAFKLLSFRNNVECVDDEFAAKHSL